MSYDVWYEVWLQTNMMSIHKVLASSEEKAIEVAKIEAYDEHQQPEWNVESIKPEKEI